MLLSAQLAMQARSQVGGKDVVGSVVADGAGVVIPGQSRLLPADQVVVLASADPRVRRDVVHRLLRHRVCAQLLDPVVVRRRVGRPEALARDPFEVGGCVRLAEFICTRVFSQSFIFYVLSVLPQIGTSYIVTRGEGTYMRRPGQTMWHCRWRRWWRAGQTGRGEPFVCYRGHRWRGQP